MSMINTKAVGLLDKCERVLSYHSFLTISFLLAFYFFVRLPDAIFVKSVSAVIYPLNALYIKDLLFSDWWFIRPDLANATATLSNISLEYPPGFFLVTQALGSVRNIYLFSFALQAMVPLFIYRLVSSVSSRLTAFLLAILSIHYFTRSNWYSPDFLIQPLMLLAVLVMFAEWKQGRLDTRTILVSGLLTSLIILLKHNIGIFFAILCGTLIYFDSFERQSSSLSRRNASWAYFLLSGFPLFGMVFISKLLYLDETIYYLLPFSIFWVLFIALLRQRSWSFNLVHFLKLSLAFGAAALLLPAIVFVWFGSVIGYSEYWHSLFGMGLDFLPIMDHGILGVIRTQHIGLDSLHSAYSTVATALLFVFPFLVNGIVVYFLYDRVLKSGLPTSEKLKYFGAGSIAIMAVFMFFPLEGYHILATKLFIFATILAFFLHRLSLSGPKVLLAALVLMALPVVGYSFIKHRGIINTEFSYGTPEMRRIIGMPMRAAVAKEIGEQVATIKRAVNNKPYYIVDSSGATLTGLAAIVDNKYPQYYMEMRKGILADESVDAILDSLERVPFAVVNKKDLDRFRDGKEDDVFLDRILSRLNDNYQIVDAYEPSKNTTEPLDHLVSFVVMKNMRYSGL